MISHFNYLFSYSFYISSETIITISETLQIYNIYSKGTTPSLVDSSLFPITVFHLTGEFE